MVRLGLRLMLVLMGGVLLVTTISLGWQRDDTRPRLLILRRNNFDQNHQLDTSLVINHPATHQVWQSGLPDSQYYLDIATTGHFIFLDGNTFYRQRFFDDVPQPISNNPRYLVGRWFSPDRKWLIYGDVPNRRADVDLFAVRTDGTARYSLSRDLPGDFKVNFESIWFSPDEQRVAIVTRSESQPNRWSVYTVRLDGTDLHLLWSQTDLEPYLMAWLELGIVAKQNGRLYLVDPITGESRALLFGVYFGEFGLIDWFPTAHLLLISFRYPSGFSYLAVREDGVIAWRLNYRWSMLQCRESIVQFTDDLNNVETINIATGQVQSTPIQLLRSQPFAYAWSPDCKWLVFNFTDRQTHQTAVWRFDVATHHLTRLWGPPGVAIFKLWVSDQGILVRAATPTWSGLLHLNSDGTDPRELTSVQDMELGEHDFVDWATLPDHPWQPLILGGAGGGLLLVGLGWPLIHKRLA